MTDQYSYYDTIVLQDEGLPDLTRKLFEMEGNMQALPVVDIEAVLCIVMGNLHDMHDLDYDDLSKLAQVTILATTDLELPILEYEVQESIIALSSAVGAYTHYVLECLESLGFKNDGTPRPQPFGLKRILDNGHLLFEKENHNT